MKVFAEYRSCSWVVFEEKYSTPYYRCVKVDDEWMVQAVYEDTFYYECTASTIENAIEYCRVNFFPF